ncbi:hypothetical protein ACFQFR_23500 [Streptomyces goshikiensis]
MSDSQQTDPATLWWSRPDGLADARRDGVPAPRPHAEGDTAAGGAGGAGASSPDPSEPGTEAGSGPRYDPWAVRPLHVVDTGKVPRGIRIWQVVAISLGAALLAGGTGGYLGVLAERRSSTRLELPRPPRSAGTALPRASPGSPPAPCRAWSPCTSAAAGAAAPEPASSSTRRATSSPTTTWSPTPSG